MAAAVKWRAKRATRRSEDHRFHGLRWDKEQGPRERPEALVCVRRRVSVRSDDRQA